MPVSLEPGREGAAERPGGAGAKHEVVVEAGSGGALSFAYRTTTEDLGFGVRLEEEEAATVVLPSVRLECAHIPAAGTIPLPKAGKCKPQLLPLLARWSELGLGQTWWSSTTPTAGSMPRSSSTSSTSSRSDPAFHYLTCRLIFVHSYFATKEN